MLIQTMSRPDGLRKLAFQSVEIWKRSSRVGRNKVVPCCDVRRRQSVGLDIVCRAWCVFRGNRVEKKAR